MVTQFTKPFRRAARPQLAMISALSSRKAMASWPQVNRARMAGAGAALALPSLRRGITFPAAVAVRTKLVLGKGTLHLGPMTCRIPLRVTWRQRPHSFPEVRCTFEQICGLSKRIDVSTTMTAAVCNTVQRLAPRAFRPPSLPRGGGILVEPVSADDFSARGL